MNEKNGVTEISLSDIIKMFRGKGKALICIIVIFSMLGCGLTLLRATYFGEYGGTVKFYVTGTGEHNDLVYLLKSESFAEKLLLDENGMPPEEICDKEAYDIALEAVNAYNEGRQRVRDALIKSEEYGFSIELPDGSYATWEDIDNEYKRLQEECNRIISLLTIYKSANADAVAEDPNHVIRTAEYEALLEQAMKEKTSFEETIYRKSLDKKNELKQVANKEFYDLKQIRDDAQEKTEALLTLWRESDEVKNKVSLIRKSLTVSYDSRSSGNKESEENHAFISIDVSVKGDAEMAEYIIDRLHIIMPDYVEKTIEKYEKDINSECMLITPFSPVGNMSMGGIIGAMAKKGVLAVIAALTVYCFIVIAHNMVRRAMDE